MSCNLDFDIINTLNMDYSVNMNSNFIKVNSNVALASAVTSYLVLKWLNIKLWLVMKFTTPTQTLYL